MLIRVIVHPPDEFQRWLQNESQLAKDDPAVRDGKAAFLAESCINCHAIRGTPARGTSAPDLTHLMGRGTLADGMIENTSDNLHRWIRNPQAIKPGCLMPAFGLDDRRLDLIVEYLLSLR